MVHTTEVHGLSFYIQELLDGLFNVPQETKDSLLAALPNYSAEQKRNLFLVLKTDAYVQKHLIETVAKNDPNLQSNINHIIQHSQIESIAAKEDLEQAEILLAAEKELEVLENL